MKPKPYIINQHSLIIIEKDFNDEENESRGWHINDVIKGILIPNTPDKDPSLYKLKYYVKEQNYDKTILFIETSDHDGVELSQELRKIIFHKNLYLLIELEKIESIDSIEETSFFDKVFYDDIEIEPVEYFKNSGIITYDMILPF